MNRKLFLSILLVFISAVSLFGSPSASAQVTLTWTPYVAGPFQVYPGGTTTDNVYVLSATGPDSWSGMQITITGPNASSFQQDTNVTPACFSTQKLCAWGIYFQAPATPAAPYTATATLTATYTDNVTNTTGTATYNLVANVLTPPTPSGSPNLSFVPPTTVYAGVPGSFGYSGNGGPANAAKLSSPGDIVFDAAGNAFIADKQNYVVRKIDTSGNISVYAGTPQVGGVGQYTGEGGPATSATLQGPVSLALDKAGNLYIGDGFTTVLVVNATTQKISTFAGSTTYAFGYSGDGGPAASALLYGANSLAIDSKGNLYILETKSGDIRKVDTSGNISTYAGKNQFYNGTFGHTPNFEGFSADGGPAASATFYQPQAIAIDASDNIYISDDTDRVRKIDATTTTITTVAGLGAASPYQTTAQTGTESTPALQAEFYGGGVSVDPSGNIYIADSLPVANVGGPILKVDSTGTITQFPSSGASYAGFLKFDSTGAMYIMDQVKSAVYKVAAQGVLAFGNENVGSTTPAQLLTLQNNGSSPITFNTTPYTISGDFGVGDSGTCSFSAPLAVGANCTVAINFAPKSPGAQTGTITFASNSATNPLVAHVGGTGVGTALVPQGVLSTPVAFTQTVNTTGNAQIITLSNPGTGPLTISSIALGGTNPTNFGLNASACPISPATLAVNGSCAITVNFTPTSATGYSATLTVTDNATAGTTQTVTLMGTGVPVVTPVAQLQFFPSQVTLFAGTVGSGCGDTGDGGLATQAVLCMPTGLTQDAAGNTYIVDSGENVVRKVDSTGIITGFAGVPQTSNFPANTGDGGPATSAILSLPSDVAIDASGNVYITDTGSGNRIRVVTAGTINAFTPAGTGLGAPYGVAIDPSGNLFIAELNGNKVIKVTPGGVASLFAGLASGTAGYNGDNIPANAAELNGPGAIRTDAAGNVYIVEINSPGTVCRIRKVSSATGMISTVAGNGTCGNTGDGGPATSAEIRALSVTVDLAGDIFFPAFGTIRKVDINGNISTVVGGGASSTVPAFPFASNDISAFNRGLDFAIVDNNGSLLLSAGTAGFQVLKAGPNGALDFGSSVVNTPTAAQTVTFENTGNTPLIFAQTTYTATGDFTVTGGTCPGLTTLASGISCTLTVIFNPTTTGPRTGTINVNSNSSAGPQLIALTGNGTPAVAPPTATLSQGSDFGSITDGTSSSPQTFTLFNTSSTTLSNISISIGGTNPNSFSQTTTCQTTLAANSNCNIFVTFSPTLATGYSATLIVTDNASPTTQTAMLTGSGIVAPVPVVGFAPNPLAFGNITVGSTSTTLTVTVSDTGTGGLQLNGISIGGANPTAFAQSTGSCDAVIGAGSSCTYGFTFTPPSVGNFTATVSVTDNASGSPQTFTLTGTGIATATDFTIAATTHTQSVQPGAVAQFNINVAALGGSYNTPVVLSVTGLPAGMTASFNPASITPGSTGATTVLSVQTPSLTGALAKPGSNNAPWLALLLLPLLGVCKLRRKLRRLPLSALILAALALGAAASITGCGGGYFGQQAQTVTLTVIGTSGPLTHSTTVTLTIQ